jgi:flagellar biosynthetic protein FliQ
MSPLVHALREGLMLVLLLSAPPVLAVLVVGLISAILQTATQVKDTAVSSVPKLLAGLAALALAGPWIGSQALAFFRAVLEAVPTIGRT